ncbi:MAG: UDP-N-acetylmuramoylalanyl-D-glutamyl-2, 6-diaminopimelate--D-alanyl-D-alanine ligase, partial [Chloroflexi bacterium]
MLTLADVLEALTSVRPPNASAVITEGAIDSRQAIPGSLFVAIPGENADGHDFLPDAFRRGASFALIQRDAEASYRTLDLRGGLVVDPALTFEPPLLLRVDNTLSALQQIARFW